MEKKRKQKIKNTINKEKINKTIIQKNVIPDAVHKNIERIKIIMM